MVLTDLSGSSFTFMSFSIPFSFTLEFGEAVVFECWDVAFVYLGVILALHTALILTSFEFHEVFHLHSPK